MCEIYFLEDMLYLQLVFNQLLNKWRIDNAVNTSSMLKMQNLLVRMQISFS